MMLRIAGAIAVVAISFAVTLLLLDSYAPRCPKGEALELKPPFQKIGNGFAFAAAPPPRARLADTNAEPTRSGGVVCKNNALLGPPHSQHVDIIGKGMGRYSHYGSSFTLAASDNTDP